MITYFWAVGIAFTIFIFAGKAGLVAGTTDIRVLKIIGLALIYGALAFLMGVALMLFNPLDYFQLFQKFMQYGIFLHLFLSFGLFAWGLYTIKSFVNENIRTKKVGYLLMFPCPICLSSMLLSTSIFSAITGVSAIKASALISVIFMVVIPTSALLFKHLNPIIVGFSMLMLGLYFVISILVVPVYSQYKAIFSLTQSTAKWDLSLPPLMGILSISLLFFGIGYLKTKREMGK
ncbi:MAG: hypothetical protein DRG25_03940 [Deltaproteobacteria bacterium]|nr:MAG: hypothetical protein DRG25_03940 [Deltaproteobacteria bacterium]